MVCICILGGAEKSRLEKMSALVNWEPAQKYLNVCVNSVKNDNKCFKCVRTMLEIDAVGDIDKFNRVFDVAFYRQNYKAYLLSCHFLFLLSFVSSLFCNPYVIPPISNPIIEHLFCFFNM